MKMKNIILLGSLLIAASPAFAQDLNLPQMSEPIPLDAVEEWINPWFNNQVEQRNKWQIVNDFGFFGLGIGDYPSGLPVQLIGPDGGLHDYNVQDYFAIPTDDSLPVLKCSEVAEVVVELWTKWEGANRVLNPDELRVAKKKAAADCLKISYDRRPEFNGRIDAWVNDPNGVPVEEFEAGQDALWQQQGGQPSDPCNRAARCLPRVILADVKNDGENLLNVGKPIPPSYPRGFPITIGRPIAGTMVTNGDGAPAGIFVVNHDPGVLQLWGQDGNPLRNMWDQLGQGDGVPIYTSYYKFVEDEGRRILRLDRVYGMGEAPGLPLSAVSLDFNQDGEGLKDVVVLTREQLRGGAHIEVYPARGEDLMGPQEAMREGGWALLFSKNMEGKDPYDMAVIDGKDVLVTTSVGIEKANWDQGIIGGMKITSKKVVEVAAPGDLRPYQVTTVDFGEACQGFAFTWANFVKGADKPNGEEGDIIKPSFGTKVSIYKAADDTCNQYALFKEFDAPLKPADPAAPPQDDGLPRIQFAAVAFSPAFPDRSLPAGVWVGSPEIFAGEDGQREAHAYFYPLESEAAYQPQITVVAYGDMFGFIDRFIEVVGVDRIPKLIGEGGVSRLKVDSYGNLGVVLGFPPTFFGEQAPPPPPPPPPPLNRQFDDINNWIDDLNRRIKKMFDDWNPFRALQYILSNVAYAAAPLIDVNNLQPFEKALIANGEAWRPLHESFNFSMMTVLINTTLPPPEVPPPPLPMPLIDISQWNSCVTKVTSTDPVIQKLIDEVNGLIKDAGYKYGDVFVPELSGTQHTRCVLRLPCKGLEEECSQKLKAVTPSMSLVQKTGAPLFYSGQLNTRPSPKWLPAGAVKLLPSSDAGAVVANVQEPWRSLVVPSIARDEGQAAAQYALPSTLAFSEAVEGATKYYLGAPSKDKSPLRVELSTASMADMLKSVNVSKALADEVQPSDIGVMVDFYGDGGIDVCGWCPGAVPIGKRSLSFDAVVQSVKDCLTKYPNADFGQANGCVKNAPWDSVGWLKKTYDVGVVAQDLGDVQPFQYTILVAPYSAFAKSGGGGGCSLVR